MGWNEGAREANEDRIEYVGPFDHVVVLVNGRTVPYLQAHGVGRDPMSITLDNRYGLDIPADLAEPVISFLAHAIAVGMGYAGHPTDEEEPRPSNPFPRLIGLSGDDMTIMDMEHGEGYQEGEPQ